ncbi:MAG: hypothetical protein K2Q33_01585, partial [Gammaproteobacteria bacterium]|nr:hypothetical protein [Gammaproteobacteria bacterium]
MQGKIVQPPQKIRKLHTTLNIPPTTTCKEFSAISGVALPPDGVGIQLFFNVEGGKQVTFAGPKGKELQTTIGGGIGNKAYQGTLLAKFQQELKEETAGVLEISQSDNSPTGYILQVRIKDQHGQEVVNIYPATFRDNLTHSVGKIETTETGLKGFHYATFTAFCDGLTEKQLVHIADYMTPTMQFCNNVFAKLTNLPFMNGYLKKFKGKSVEEAQALWNSEAEIAIRAQLAEEFAMQYHSLQEKGQILLQPQQLLQYTEGGRTVSYQNFEQGLKDLFVNAPSPAVLNDGFLKQIGKCSERPFYEVFATDELMDKAKLSQ